MRNPFGRRTGGQGSEAEAVNDQIETTQDDDARAVMEVGVQRAEGGALEASAVEPSKGDIGEDRSDENRSNEAIGGDEVADSTPTVSFSVAGIPSSLSSSDRQTIEDRLLGEAISKADGHEFCTGQVIFEGGAMLRIGGAEHEVTYLLRALTALNIAQLRNQVVERLSEGMAAGIYDTELATHAAKHATGLAEDEIAALKQIDRESRSPSSSKASEDRDTSRRIARLGRLMFHRQRGN